MRGERSGSNTPNFGATEATHDEPSWNIYGSQDRRGAWPGHIFFALAHRRLAMHERWMEASFRFYRDLCGYSMGGMRAPKNPAREERETRVVKLELSGTRGVTLKDTIALPNPTMRPVDLDIRLQRFHKETTDGKLRPEDIIGSERWVELSQNRVHLSPYQSAEITVKVDTKNISPGDYQGIITVESTPHTFGRTVIVVELYIEPAATTT